MERGPEQTQFQGRHTDGQHIYGKIFNISGYKEKANQTHNKIHFIPVRMAIVNTKKNNNNPRWWQGRWMLYSSPPRTKLEL